VGRAMEKAEGKTMESTQRIRDAINEVVESATSRCADATEDMRRTATNIRTELESTREEIKRGVIEMPEEAKESTTAIRRAVTEQINALKELSEIVARSGRTIDIPDHRPSHRPAPPAAPIRAAVAEPVRRPVAPPPQPERHVPPTP